MAKHIIIITGLLIVMLMLPRTAHGDNGIIESFEVIPVYCVVEQGQHCQGEFSFQWQLHTESDICIFRRAQEYPLYCGSSPLRGEITLAIDVPIDHEFVMVASGNHAVAKVQLLELGVDVRRTRRHLWSVF